MAKRHNPNDATLRNIRALKKRVTVLAARITVLERAAVSRVGGRKR